MTDYFLGQWSQLLRRKQNADVVAGQAMQNANVTLGSTKSTYCRFYLQQVRLCRMPMLFWVGRRVGTVDSTASQVIIEYVP